MVNNKIDYKTICSDLVYPNWTDRKKYQVLGKLDEEYVQEELERLFECDSIGNKYAIQMPDGVLWYQHDKHTFLLKPIDESL